MYNVIIVGGGPAGASAGYFLAQKGLKCLLLDKAKFPREKPCGGAITASAITQFPFLKELMEIGNYTGWLHYKKPEESIPTTREEPIAYFVRRIKFDNDLLQLAKDSGVEVQENQNVKKITQIADKVQVETATGEHFEAEFLFGADGISSNVRAALGLDQFWQKDKMCIVFMNEIELDSATIEKYYQKKRVSHIHLGYAKDPKDTSMGYGWVFAKKNHVNIGFGEILKGTDSRTILKHYFDYVETCQLNNLLPKLPDSIPRPRSYPLQASGPMKKFATGRCLLLGDAAGFIHPMSGEGIVYAIWSGQIAAENIYAVCNHTLSVEALEKEYSDRCWKEFGNGLHKMAQLHDMGLKKIGIFFHLARFDPQLRDLQAAIMDSDIPFDTIKWRIVWRLMLGMLKGNWLRK